MTETVVVSLARDAFMTSLYICLPMLAAALVTGVVVSILQVATSISDPTLATVPKILAVFVAMLICLNWIIQTMLAYTTRILTSIPGMVG